VINLKRDSWIMSRSETILKAERTQINESMDSMHGKSPLRALYSNTKRES
jgi:hypothetical protein